MVSQHTSSSNRYSWLDWANVLSMVMVVLFHIPSEHEPPIRDIEYIAVNIPFFLLSGVAFRIYLEHRKNNLSVAGFAKSRLKRFGTPTVVFFSFFYLLWLLIGKQLAGDTEEWYIPLLELIKGHPVTVLATYWFIFCLVSIHLIYFIIYHFTKNRLIILGICVSLHLLTLICDIPDYYEMDRALTFIPIFALGTCFSCSDEHKHDAITLALILIILCGTMGVAGCSDVSINDEGKGYIAGSILAVVIISASYLLSKLLGCPHLISFLRTGSLVLLATQNNIIGVCKVLLDKITGTHDFLAHHIYYKPIVLLIVYIASIPIISLLMTQKGRKLNCI